MARITPAKLPAISSSEILESLEKKERVVKNKFDPREHKDRTRSKVAFSFTRGYFWLLLLALVGVPLHNIIVVTHGLDSALILPTRDILLTVAGILGGPIGFVVGYYFKGSER